MKRDDDLIREILLAVEKREDFTITGADLWIEGWTQAEVTYHLLLLNDAGFLLGERVPYIGPGPNVAFYVERLTFAGHEFLDTVRDAEIWKKAKAGSRAVTGISLELLKEIAKAYAKDALKQALNLSL
jgi:hypothetical protein